MIRPRPTAGTNATVSNFRGNILCFSVPQLATDSLQAILQQTSRLIRLILLVVSLFHRVTMSGATTLSWTMSGATALSCLRVAIFWDRRSEWRHDPA